MAILTVLSVVWRVFDVWSNLEFIGQKAGLIWRVLHFFFATQTGANVLVVSFVLLFVSSLLFQIERAKTALPDAPTSDALSESTALTKDRISTVPAARMPNVHAECEKTIARLLESESVHAMRAQAHEDALKTFRKEYFVPLAVADNQKAEIGKYLEVLRVCTHDPKLDDPMPTIKWAILFKNRSVHRISLVGDVGPLFFEGHKLTEHKDILEDKVMGLYPDRDGSIVFEQRLSTPEVNLLKSLPNGKFEFDKVMVYAKRISPDAEENIPADRVVIFSRFRATLGKCSDEKSQAIDEAAARLDSLRAELNETRLKLDRENIAERKALIASWRACIAKVFREYSESGYTFTGLLASQDDYLSLAPNLSPETKTAIEDAAYGDYGDIRRLVNTLAEDIARIEREWGL